MTLTRRSTTTESLGGRRLWWVVGACVVIGLILRVPFVPGTLESDEAGLLLVVRHWDPSDAELYGHYWIDRPPLLLGYFWLADLFPGEVGVRLLGCLFGALLVTAAALAGGMLGGRGGAWAGGLVAASLGSSYLLAAHQLNGMVQGAALVMASCAATVAAAGGSERGSDPRIEPSPARLGLWALAGALGCSALLVKQNLVGGLAFAFVVLVVSWLMGELSTRRMLRGLAALLAGAGAVAGALVVWATVAGVDHGDLWYALYRFRMQAAEAIAQASMAAPLDRLEGLLASFVVSGLVLVTFVFVGAAPGLFRDRRLRRYVAGVVAMLVVAFAGIAGGGSWWNHYLLQLVPSASLMAALTIARHREVARAGVALVVAAAVGATAVGIHIEREPSSQVQVARQLADVARSGDTAFVAYGNAEILLYAGLSSDYPHLWSLPMRVMDPRLDALVSELRGPRAPTWIVQVNSFDSWGIDSDGDLTNSVERRYRLVSAGCGYRIHLLRGVDRPAPRTGPCEPQW